LTFGPLLTLAETSKGLRKSRPLWIRITCLGLRRVFHCRRLSTLARQDQGAEWKWKWVQYDATELELRSYEVSIYGYVVGCRWNSGIYRRDLICRRRMSTCTPFNSVLLWIFVTQLHLLVHPSQGSSKACALNSAYARHSQVSLDYNPDE